MIVIVFLCPALIRRALSVRTATAIIAMMRQVAHSTFPNSSLDGTAWLSSVQFFHCHSCLIRRFLCRIPLLLPDDLQLRATLQTLCDVFKIAARPLSKRADRTGTARTALTTTGALSGAPPQSAPAGEGRPGTAADAAEDDEGLTVFSAANRYGPYVFMGCFPCALSFVRIYIYICFKCDVWLQTGDWLLSCPFMI